MFGCQQKKWLNSALQILSFRKEVCLQAAKNFKKQQKIKYGEKYPWNEKNNLHTLKIVGELGPGIKLVSD